MTAAFGPQRRAAAMLLAVVVLVASATLTATGLIISGTSRDLSVKTEALVAESRSTSRGLVIAVQAELDGQLEDLLSGSRPDLGDAASWLSSDDSRQWVARVVRGGSRLDPDAMIRSEAGKLNLNTMPEAVLRALDAMPEDAVTAIVQGRPFASVRDAVAAAEAGMDAPWVPLVTVYSSDPPRSSGRALDAGADRLRMPTGSEPAPDRPAFVAESGYDPFTAEQKPAGIAELYHQCVDNNVSVGTTGRLLDLIAFADEPSVGLLDINTAPAECLAALPGLSPEIAEELVDTRSRLSASELSALNWPVRELVLTTGQLEAVLPLITTRSLQWSLEIEAGLVVGEADDPSAASLEYPVRHALVIDTSARGSRVIMIRDETNAGAAVPPPLAPVVEDSAVGLLAERAASQPRRGPARPGGGWSMSSTTSNAVVCLEGSRLAAVQTETTRTGLVTVKAAVCKSVPGLCDEPTGPASVEIRKILNADGFARNVCLALPRHEVIIKQLTIRCGQLEDADLMPMVRLALGRENSVDLPSVEVDYTVIGREDQNATVLVAAVDRSRLDRLRALLSGAGRRINSIRVRTDGLAPFAPGEQTTLMVAPGPSGCEFAVVDGGVTMLSRASQDSITPEQIRVEADRTLFSSRMVNPDLATQSPVLVSSSAAEFPETWVHAPAPPSLPAPGKALQNVHLPLLGLAIEEPGPHRIDWQSPQKPADRSAPARQKAMLAAFVLIAMVGTSWVLGNNRTTQLDDAIAAASAQRSKAFEEFLGALVDQARLEHETRWTRAKVDWAAHLDSLIATLPPPGEVLLNEISGRSETRVTFRPGDQATLPGEWGIEHRVRLDLSGHAKDRATNQALRAALLAREQSDLIINGADTDDEFNLQLTTPLASPKEAGR